MKKLLLTTLCASLCISAFSQSKSIRLVKDINPGPASSMPSMMGTLPGGELLFSAYDSVNGAGIWKSDGTANGTVRIKSLTGKMTGIGIVLNGKHLFVYDDFTHGDELWMTDGTAGGTQMIKDIFPGRLSGINEYSFDRRRMMLYNGKVYFAANDGTSGFELWSTDGTATGTQMVKNINTYKVRPNSREEGSDPNRFVVAMGKLYFVASTEANGYELYESDGTTAGTKMVTDLYPGDRSGVNSWLTAFNNKLYFKAVENDSIGSELYCYDGNSIALVKDINPTPREGSGFGGSGFQRSLVVDNKLYFASYGDKVGTHINEELWVTDGTTAGTRLVKDVMPGPEASFPMMLGSINNKLLFYPNLLIAKIKDQELWISDGTTAGTNMIKMLDSTDRGFIPSISSNNWFLNSSIIPNEADGRYYFGGKKDHGSQEFTLWMTNGTDTGTYMVDTNSTLNNFWDVLISGDDMWISIAIDGKGTELCYLKKPTAFIANTTEQEDFFTVYPNPANNGKVTVKIDGTHDKGFLLVTDVTGRMVYNQSVNKTDREVYLDLNTNAKGMYYITLKLGSAEMTHSVVLQ